MEAAEARLRHAEQLASLGTAQQDAPSPHLSAWKHHAPQENGCLPDYWYLADGHTE